MKTYNEHLEDAALKQSSIEFCEIETLIPPIYKKIVRKAADVYAKGVTIGFAYWTDNNVYKQLGLETWKDRYGNEYTTSELYDIFINELNQSHDTKGKSR